MAETLNRLDLAPAWVDEHLRPTGECGICGWLDARHRVLDAIVGRVTAGDSARSVAEDYGVPVRFVGRICREYSAPAACASCNGEGGGMVRSGEEWDWEPCEPCRGTGQTPPVGQE